jgi:histidinol-phosphate aminotransferase
MVISRRNLFRHVGVGVAASVALPSLARASIVARGGGLSRPEAPGVTGAVEPLRLHRNESAYGPSASVIAAIRGAAVSLTSRYPDAPDEALRNKLAALHAVTSDQVVLGCGSGEILCMAVSAILGFRGKIIVAQPTFELIADRARRAGGQVVSVPLRTDHSYDLEAMLSLADAGTALVYVCNPNNPTGSLTRRRDLEAFIRRLPPTAHVLIDEAYHHYVGGSSEYASFIDCPVNDRRVIVTRSFSTIHGLAGLRVGYAVAAPETAALLASHGLPDNVNGVAALAAIAALDDTEHVRTSARRNADDRQEFYNQGHARMLRPIDSHANFVMLNTLRPAGEIVDHFRRNGVPVSGPFPTFDKHIRVSLGTPAEMREFWRVWDLLPLHDGMTM